MAHLWPSHPKLLARYEYWTQFMTAGRQVVIRLWQTTTPTTPLTNGIAISWSTTYCLPSSKVVAIVCSCPWISGRCKTIPTRDDAVLSEPAFFKLCRVLVKHHLVLMHYLVVRIDRSRRTENPEWRPETAQPVEGQSSFFRLHC